MNVIQVRKLPSKEMLLNLFFPIFSLPEAHAVGDPCTLDIQCQYNLGTLSTCHLNKCRCEDGAHDFKNECYRTSRLGEHCRFRENCLLRGSKVEVAYCIDGICQCDRNMMEVSGPEGDICIPASNLGEPCNGTVVCKPSGSECDGICRCKVGYTTSSNDSVCLPG